MGFDLVNGESGRAKRERETEGGRWMSGEKGRMEWNGEAPIGDQRLIGADVDVRSKTS